ncbi:retrovirus-related pol polyprotein from transposon TNT 1-94 [Tanacetum coccineum]|uniref:Retrovirus-related pol polyprotein from transposon TNT 1-94 n=1 Tax=Tanacetum coccineum TaxID=301880 RepID=A0ABQ5DX43_9ASTR
MNQVLNENERLLEQVINKDTVNIIMNSSMDNASVNVHKCEKCLKLETELLNKKDFIEKETYDKLFRSFTTLEKHCISLEVDTQLNQEFFQRENFVSNQSALSFDQYFEFNVLKAQSQEKDTVIKNLWEKVLVITALEDELSKLKGKALVDNVVCNHTIDPEMLKIDEEAAILREIVEQGKLQNPLNESLDSAFKSSLKNKNNAIEPKGTTNVQHSKLNANSEPLCVKCDGCMLLDNYDLCVLDFINDVNARTKSKSVKKIGNACPLTRITITNEVPLRKPTALESDTPKPVVTLVYSRKPKKSKTNILVSKPKNIKSLSTNKKEPNKSWGSIVSDVPSSPLDECRIGDYQIGNVTISRVYYVEGLGHNLFSVGQFCDSNLEVAFRQHTCFIRNLEGVDLLTGSRGNNLYTLSLRDMMSSSSICLLSKASKSKSWLWHRRLSHLNFGAINHLARHDLVRGLPKLKFEKDHLCSACAMGKSKKKPYKPKSKDTNQEKLYLLHMDLCRPMRVASVNGKKSKDETLDFTIKFLKMIQVRLKVPVRRIRTDNGTEFVNQTLCEYYEKVRISHETSVARSPRQNGVVERRSRILIEVSRTMLIYAKALLFLWDILFQLLFDELLTPPPSVDHPAPEVIALIAEVVASDAAASTGDVEEYNHDLDVAHMNNNPFFGISIPENDSEASSSSDVIPTVTTSSGKLKRPVSISTNSNFNEQALIAMQEELNEFERLEVWELVLRLDKVMVITLKWIYKVKLDELGGILKNKARLVARGYRQERDRF